MKHFLALCIVAAGFIPLPAAPLKWSCSWPEARSQTFSLYRGETATFEPVFVVNGKAATNLTIEAVYYQTNGMADAWWQLPGATFAPSNDCGAASYRFFVRAADAGGVNYRANGVIRMIDSPGFTPGEVALPIRRLDFSTVEVVNAPYYTQAETAAALREGLAVAASSATNYTDSVTTNLNARPVTIPTTSAGRGVTFIDQYGEDQNVAIEIGEGAKAAVTTNELEAAADNKVVRSAGVAVGGHASVMNPADPLKIQGVALGWHAQVSAINGVAIGSGAQHTNETGQTSGATVASAPKAIAIGYAAKAGAADAVQLGEGENTEAGTLKYRNVTVVKDGKVATDPAVTNALARHAAKIETIETDYARLDFAESNGVKRVTIQNDNYTFRVVTDTNRADGVALTMGDAEIYGTAAVDSKLADAASSATNYTDSVALVLQADIATNSARIAALENATPSSGGYSWNRPDAWAVDVVIDSEILDTSVEDWETVDDCGRVCSNATFTTVYGMSAQCSPVLLDDSSMAQPVVQEWRAYPPGCSISATGHVTAEASGIYRVSACDTNGVIRYADVAISAERSETVSNVTVYVADLNAARDAVQLAALDVLSAASNPVTNHYGQTDYVIWQTFTPRIVPTSLGMGQFKHFAVSPHVTASATHYPTHPFGSLTFDDGAGGTATVRETRYVNLRDWAVVNGFTEPEAASVQDIALYVCDGSTEIPDGCIPWFMSEATLQAVYGGSLEGLAAWAAVQAHVEPLPVTLGNAYGNLWSCYYADIARMDIAPVLRAMGQRYPVHVGDSGRPVFLMLDYAPPKPVVVGHFTGVFGCQANYIRGLPIIKAFVESVGDTLKTL